jgi:peptide chain release factor subunit 1
MEEKEKQHLEEILEKLRGYRGSHTELISVLIPAGFQHSNVTRQLEAEKGTAKNIKSTGTRNNVIDALDTIIRYLKGLKKTPENGIALYCGNISKVEGQTDIQIFDIEPPMPMKTRLYRCDKEFMIEPLEEMLKVSEVYGLLVMDRKEATIGVLEGKRIKVLEKMTSGVPSKVRAGGQSSQRFHRITEGLVKEFYKRIAEAMKNNFYEMPKLKGIIVGGPIPTKDEFLEQGFLPTQLQEKVIGAKDIGDADESGLKELVTKSQDLLAQQEIIYEKKLLQRFFETLGGRTDFAAYGKENVKKALEYGAVEILILSKKIDKQDMKELVELGESIDSKVEIVSDETEEGKQFLNLTGIGAILRFKI